MPARESPVRPDGHCPKSGRLATRNQPVRSHRSCISSDTIRASLWLRVGSKINLGGVLAEINLGGVLAAGGVLAGLAPDGKLADWWRYVTDPNAVFLTD